jgi:V/A-type H+/Na+-transporting ATPase subunit C
VRTEFAQRPTFDADNWRHAFAVGAVRVLETRLLTRPFLANLAAAQDDAQLEAQLRHTDYAVESGAAGPLPARLEPVLLSRRQAVRDRFDELVDDAEVIELFRSRTDFHNLRVLLRQAVAGRDFAAALVDDGAVPTATLQDIFAEERYGDLPEHLGAAVEAAIPAYFAGRDPRQIDFAVDRAQATFRLRRGRRLGSAFLVELARMTADLTNIRTACRVKWLDQEVRILDSALLPGGHVERGVFAEVLTRPWDDAGPLFGATPYADLVADGVEGLAQEASFIRLERLCDEYAAGLRRHSREVVAGVEPIVAYLLAREAEIRNVRMIVSARHSGLDANRIIDRLAQTY